LELASPGNRHCALSFSITTIAAGQSPTLARPAAPLAAAFNVTHALLLLPYANAIYRMSLELNCVEKKQKWLPRQRPLKYFMPCYMVRQFDVLQFHVRHFQRPHVNAYQWTP